MAIGQQ